ncbi:MAG: 1-deoxy-D-xylulose-5-phosphate reductoisomerase [Blastopirellula sp.]|nr:MAG: 1-deoxy-D-xylulose-5-phosphate reductoisomerase [Blastopirellula sp.]
MTNSPKKIAILGATGSIGQSTLEVISGSPEHFQAYALTAHHSLGKLVELAKTFRPRYIVATDPIAAKAFDWSEVPADTELIIGHEAVKQVVSDSEVDTVVSAIVGRAGLEGTWAALEAGKRVALANKETLVLAGSLAMQLVNKHGGEILPIDSEHSAVFQGLEAGRKQDVARIILTASGGPFRNHTLNQLKEVTVEQALDHPTWDMGPKITIDSATMMNKALEIIEARWLFDIPANQIDVVVHPQSIIHSFVEYIDGSVMAQLSPPDMKLPIQYALSYPERRPSPASKLDFTQSMSLEFETPDMERFPALLLGKEVAERGGTTGAVLNAANEAAVASFLDNKIRFLDIVTASRAALDNHNFESNPTLDRLLELDVWARREVSQWIACC